METWRGVLPLGSPPSVCSCPDPNPQPESGRHSRPPARSPPSAREPLERSMCPARRSPFLGGGLASLSAPPRGRRPHSLSPQLRAGREGLPRVPGPGRWRQGQRGQRAAREPGAAGRRAQPPPQAGRGAGRSAAAAAGPGGRPRARASAALGVNMLRSQQPGDTRGLREPAGPGPPARRAPVARSLELPAALRAVAGRRSARRAPTVRGQSRDAARAAPRYPHSAGLSQQQL